MAYGEPNGYVTDVVTTPKGQTCDPNTLRANTSKTAGDLATTATR